MTAIIGDAKQINKSTFGQRFGVIVADPPWPYRVSIKQGAAEDQYNVMTDQDLIKMPLSEITKDDAVLFLWGTWPKLPECINLMTAWGFEYKTGFPWIKTTTNGAIDYGVGYWVRGVSEYILIGVRGKVSCEPLRLEGYMGLIAPNFKHSKKPESVHQLAERLPGPYLELFARRPKKGWTCFGNDEGLRQQVLMI